MKQSYNNPLVTYDEIVDALKSIIECSLSSNYVDDFDYLNINYESGTKNKVDEQTETALYNALKSLEKGLDTSSKIIRNTLERDIENIDKYIFKINTDYLIGQEKRKLAAQQNFIQKLKAASLKMDVLYQVPMEDEKIEPNNNVDSNTVFSDFEKKVISDFPLFFKEEIDLANETNKELENTVEIKNTSAHNYVAPEDLQVKETDEEKKLKEINDKLQMIERAIMKAKELGDDNIVASLEKKYEEELKSDS